MKPLARSLLLILVLLACFFGARAFWVRDDLESAGTLVRTELKHGVRILRDEDGIPHIFAEDPEDLSFAFGYAEARDRLWQLDLNRHVVNGTLSEALGARAIRADLFFRTIGLPKAAALSLERSSPETRADLEAFAKGVNAYATIHKGSLPLEFALTGHPFEPLDAKDCAGTAVLLAWQLSLNMEDELLSLKVAAQVGRDRLPLFFPEAPETFLPPEAGAALSPGIPPAAKPEGAPASLGGLDPRELHLLASGLDPILPPASSAASNNWVVGGERSTSGKPLFANDPHLALGLPSIWYEVQLVAPGLDVVGAAVPGLPYVEIGHNRRIAFGFTNVMADNQDLFVEKRNPTNPNEVQFEGGWEELRHEKVLINVKGGASVEKEILFSRHGPLLNEIHPDLEHPIALKWTAHDLVRGADSFRRLDYASGWEDARSAMKELAETCLNLAYADVDGNIGWQVGGRIPLRAKGNGRFPVPGWTGEYEWVGAVPFEELPSYYLPAGGPPRISGSLPTRAPTHVIATANQRSIHDGYPYAVSNSWATPYRFFRLSELLAGGKRLSIEDLKKVQCDRHAVLAPVVVGLLEGIDAKTPEIRAATALLRGWDGEVGADSSGAALFELFLFHLQREAYLKELGPVFSPYSSRLGSYYTGLDALLADSKGVYWSALRPPEGKAVLLERALRAAFRDAKARLGDDPHAWRWGSLHHVVFHHALGGAWPLGMLLNRSRPLGGDSNTVNNGTWSARDPFDLAWGSSYRLLVDLKDPAHAQAMNATGESGRPFTRHYDDMIRPWAEGRYHTRWTAESDILAHRSGELDLVPAPSGPTHTKGS
jgi:penicillin amidase